jgi:hypothetical protein
MATSKAKRLIALAQPKPQRRGMNPKNNSNLNASARPQGNGVAPVKAHVYRSIAELNGGFEKVVHELQTLGGNSLFRLSGLTAMRETICRMRAQANRDFARAIQDRESVNAGHSSAAP